MGPSDGGLCRQVVLIRKCISISITEVVNEPAYSGHCRQVVLIRKCISITEVVNEPAYSGHCRQVLILHEKSIRLVSLDTYILSTSTQVEMNVCINSEVQQSLENLTLWKLCLLLSCVFT